MSFVADVSRRDGRVVISVSGELDLGAAPDFRQCVVGVVADGGTDLVVDLTLADYVDSVGVGLLLGALKRVRTHGGRLSVVAGEERITRVLDLTELSSIIPVHASLDAALATERTE